MSTFATARDLRASSMALRPPLRGERGAESPASAERAGPRLHGALVFLLATWTLPFVVSVGSLRLTPYRAALLILAVPTFTWLLEGRAGRMRLPDIFIVLFALWSVISLTAVHGPNGIQTGGINTLETLVPYFLARCCIRTADDFLAFARALTVIVLALLPFALFETVTGHNLYIELASHIFPSVGITDKDPRWGLRRVQLFFEHPILMGVCCGSVLGLTHLVVGRELSFGRRWSKSAAVFITAATSLSSGPLSGLVVQGFLLGWNGVLSWLRVRWIILLGLVGLFVVLVQIFAKRPLINILLSFAFEPNSAFFRLVIWDYGTKSVANHPLYGVGMGQWDRPSWMAPSIDMFWLYNAITFGLPGGLLMFGFFCTACLTVAFTSRLDQRHQDYRIGYLISMASFFLCGWMVHFWNGTYVFFVLMVGAGLWLRDAPRVEENARLLARQSARSGQRATRQRPAQRAFDQKLEPERRQARVGRKR